MLPAAGLKVVAPVVLVPVLRHPMPTTAFANEMPVNPHVPMTIPAVVPGSPNESRTRRRRYDYTRLRRCDLDVDPDLAESRSHGANEHRCPNRGQYQRGQTSHSRVHFESTSIH
jgi:hypothetical protein